jgi:CheY-like chemotaxis protein
MMLKQKRIFYFEDSLTNRSIVQLLLEKAGSRFAFARCLHDDPLAQLHKFMPVDLILLDLMLPNGMTGYDIFDAIRADTAFEKTPIVALTASDPTLEMPKVRAKGFSGYISKPIKLMNFTSQISAVLDGIPVWDT